MTMTELLVKKRDGFELTDIEINEMIEKYTKGEIPDYQMSAMLMAIFIKGMNDRETLTLTKAMINSGDTIDLSEIQGIKADKHSTGGVGDKTSLILCPMLAAVGVKMAKLSGRGLGHTGGTLDKLMSFEGLTTSLPMEKFIQNVNEIGFAIAGQTANLVPADKKLYALRDVTGTVPSRPLIVSSIMSKKLASGADVIVLDVKTGSGAFMKTDEEAFELASDLVRVGVGADKKVAAVVTDMDQPLGAMIGNSLEVKEAIFVLKGETKGALLELCVTLAANIMLLTGDAKTEENARETLLKTLENGSALNKLAELVTAQGGNAEDVFNPERLPKASILCEVKAEKEGYVTKINAEEIGIACLHLGGGRLTKESEIDLAVGVEIKAEIGDMVKIGDLLAIVHANGEEEAKVAVKNVREAFTLSENKPEKMKLIRGVVR